MQYVSSLHAVCWHEGMRSLYAVCWPDVAASPTQTWKMLRR